MGIVIVVIVVLAFVGLIVYGIISKRKREQAMAALAAKNGWTALGNDEVTLSGYLPEFVRMLGQQGYGFGSFNRNTVSYDMAYQATAGSHKAVFFQYQYTEYRRSADPNTPDTSTTYTFTVLNLAMPVAEPTILLLHHSFLSKLANFGLHHGLQKLSLEGDFNDTYDTYIQPNDQVNALSLLTPDVMEDVEALAGTKAQASLQIGGQSVIISFENQMLTPEFIEPLMAQVATLLAKLDAKPRAILEAKAPGQPAAPASSPAVVTPTIVAPTGTPTHTP